MTMTTTATVEDDRLRDLLGFYFGDSNLARDRFLRHQMAEREDGMVPVQVLLSFNRIKQLGVPLKDIVRGLQSIDWLHVSEDGSLVGRVHPPPAHLDAEHRTIYVERLPAHSDHIKLGALFGKFGKVTYVALPRLSNGHPKGFCFIEYDKDEMATNALEQIMAIKDKDLATIDPSDQPFRSMRVLSYAEWKRLRGEYMEYMKKQRQLVNELLQQRKPPLSIEKTNSESEAAYKHGLIVRLDGVPSEMEPREFRALLAPSKSRIAYLDHAKGQTTAHIRFAKASHAQRALPILSAHVPIQAHVLEGDAEGTYWDKIIGTKEPIEVDSPKNKERLAEAKKGKDKSRSKGEKNTEVKQATGNNDLGTAAVALSSLAGKKKPSAGKKKPSASKKKRTHIKFGDSDDEGVHNDLPTGEKRKHAHEASDETTDVATAHTTDDVVATKRVRTDESV